MKSLTTQIRSRGATAGSMLPGKADWEIVRRKYLAAEYHTFSVRAWLDYWRETGKTMEEVIALVGVEPTTSVL